MKRCPDCGVDIPDQVYCHECKKNHCGHRYHLDKDNYGVCVLCRTEKQFKPPYYEALPPFTNPMRWEFIEGEKVGGTI